MEIIWRKQDFALGALPRKGSSKSSSLTWYDATTSLILCSSFCANHSNKTTQHNQKKYLQKIQSSRLLWSLGGGGLLFGFKPKILQKKD